LGQFMNSHIFFFMKFIFRIFNLNANVRNFINVLEISLNLNNSFIGTSKTLQK
jgi:hypothetical protein